MMFLRDRCSLQKTRPYVRLYIRRSGIFVVGLSRSRTPQTSGSRRVIVWPAAPSLVGRGPPGRHLGVVYLMGRGSMRRRLALHHLRKKIPPRRRLLREAIGRTAKHTFQNVNLTNGKEWGMLIKHLCSLTVRLKAGPLVGTVRQHRLLNSGPRIGIPSLAWKPLPPGLRERIFSSRGKKECQILLPVHPLAREL